MILHDPLAMAVEQYAEAKLRHMRRAAAFARMDWPHAAADETRRAQLCDAVIAKEREDPQPEGLEPGAEP